VLDIQLYNINDYKKYKLADTIDYYHVLLKFDVSTLASETQSLGLLKNKHISASYITINNIKKDIIYTGLVSEIKSGKCNPLIISFDQKLE
jgi:hypothetical protein